jgi:hypothetical protein
VVPLEKVRLFVRCLLPLRAPQQLLAFFTPSETDRQTLKSTDQHYKVKSKSKPLYSSQEEQREISDGLLRYIQNCCYE